MKILAWPCRRTGISRHHSISVHMPFGFLPTDWQAQANQPSLDLNVAYRLYISLLLTFLISTDVVAPRLPLHTLIFHVLRSSRTWPWISVNVHPPFPISNLHADLTSALYTRRPKPISCQPPSFTGSPMVHTNMPSSMT